MNPKQKAGRLGGLATVAKHGRGHMQEIGRRGAAAFWQRYTVKPVAISAWAIVDRQSGKIKGLTGYSF